MKLRNSQILDAYEAIGTLLDKELPVLFSFKLAENLMKLEGYSKAFSVAVNNYRKSHPGYDPSNTETDKEIVDLLLQEKEVDIQPITETELKQIGTITVRTLCALKPITTEG